MTYNTFMEHNEEIWNDVEITRDISGILLVEAIANKLGSDYFNYLLEGIKKLELIPGDQGDSAAYADRNELAQLLNGTHMFLPGIDGVLPGINKANSSEYYGNYVIVGSFNRPDVKGILFQKIKETFVKELTAYSLGSNKSFTDSRETYESVCVSPLLTDETPDNIQKVYLDLTNGLVKLDSISRLPENI